MKNAIILLDKEKSMCYANYFGCRQINDERSAKAWLDRYNELDRAIKILNEESVKRSELIDFMDYLIEEKYCLENPSDDIVDEYLKSINDAKRN